MDKSRYILNALFNQGAFAINVVLALILSPFVVSRLGDESYGLWTLIVSVTGYYSFIDLGIRSAVGQYVTRHLAAKDWDRLGKTIRTSMLILTGIAGAILVLSVAVAYLFPAFFKVDPSKWHAIRFAILLAGAGMAMKFPAGVFQAVVTGSHRWDIYSSRAIVVRLINAAAVVGMLQMGLGLIGVAIATLGSQLLEGALMYRAARTLVPEVRFEFGFDRAAFDEIKNFGIFASVIIICEQIILYTSAFIVGLHMGPVAVTYFTIGSNLIPYMDNLVLSVSGQLRQVAIAYDAGNMGDAMQRLFLRGSRYVTAFVGIIFVNILVSGPDFLGTWMGWKYLSGAPFPSSGTVLLILAAAHLAYNMSTVPRQIMFGQRKNNVLAVTAVLEAVANLGLSLVLVRFYGIIGVALGTLLPMVLFEGFIIPWLTAVQVGVAPWRYWTHSALPNLAVVAVAGAAGLSFREWLPLEGWWKVAIESAFVSAVYLPLAFFAIADRDMRSKLLERIGLGSKTLKSGRA